MGSDSGNVAEFLKQYAFEPSADYTVESAERGVEKLESGCSAFLEKVGYDSDRIEHRVYLDPEGSSDLDQFVADFVIRQRTTESIRILACTLMGERHDVNHERNSVTSMDLASRYFDYFGTLDYRFFIIFTNYYLIIAEPDGSLDVYAYDRLTKSEAEEIRTQISPLREHGD
ncbi:hypothetical protein [Natronobeatus ordinarius]|uniref:hypothetical protein n=1 Tax=Natronobeatus ordinarius TaxID=2963433 RepID=UPI0020CED449|nr:hypothetical protein [Natronobeatus ordinarius]